MSASMEQFHQIFFEEADELVQAMESELLEMVFDADNPERINTVFRAAHSIKGGAATFGFTEIADTTHVMETLMDCVRDGTMKATRALVDLLLGAVDCVTDMLAAAKAGEAVDAARAEETKRALQSFLDNRGELPTEPAGADDDSGQGSNAVTEGSDGGQGLASGTPPARRYVIGFKPSLELFKTGNDPLHVFRALRELGELQVSVHDDSVPALAGFEADKLYLAWTLTLTTHAEPDVVREAFDWVEDACEISIEIDDDPGDAAAAGCAGPKGDASEARPARADGAEGAQTAAAGSTGGSGESIGSDSPQSVSESSDPSPSPAPTGEAAGRADVEGERSSSPTRAERKVAANEATSIRVGIDKIDTLINLVGELVITQSMLGQMGENIESCDLEKLREGFAQLERHTRELQENVMKIRMVPISNVFNRLPRMIHDLGSRLGKKVDLQLRGEQTEMDKTVLERIGDPLVHLVRNAVDHGIEMPDVRRAAGKPETGVLELKAYHANGNIVIEIRDDGAGLNTEKILAKARANGLVSEADVLSDQQVNELVFHPGFSTADEVSDISGRGVGMDVVKRNIQDLGGAVDVVSERGQGSVFTIRLPLTLAIVDGQLIQVADQVYVVPLVSILESIQLQEANLRSITRQGQLYRIRGEYVPVVALTELFDIAVTPERGREPLLVVVESGQGKIGLLVDDLLAQQQVVIKSLESNFRRVEGIAGATILGDGTVALILDIPGLVTLARQGAGQARAGAAQTKSSSRAA
jgi:two-component system chemotaxis sensor kinase CheA